MRRFPTRYHDFDLYTLLFCQRSTPSTVIPWRRRLNGAANPRYVDGLHALPKDRVLIPAAPLVPGNVTQITALSKYFRAPIHIVQAGTRLVKFGEDLPSGRGPLLISCALQPASPLPLLTLESPRTFLDITGKCTGSERYVPFLWSPRKPSLQLPTSN